MRRWLAVAAGGVFLIVAEQVEATKLGFQLDDARRLLDKTRERGDYLRFELERRTTPTELATLARERLGMVPPSPDAVVELERANDRPLQAPPLLADAGAALFEGPAAAPAPVAARLEGLRFAGLAAARTQLLSWLLPPDPPRWR